MEHIATLLGNEKLAMTTEKDPNVLALSKNDYTSGYFPLLPVTQSSSLKTLNSGKPIIEEEKVFCTETIPYLQFEELFQIQKVYFSVV